MKTEIETQDLGRILVCAFRYALGRSTYVTSDCRDWLEQHWTVLTRNQQMQIQEDIKIAIRDDMAGMECDRREWRKLLTLKVKEVAPC